MCMSALTVTLGADITALKRAMATDSGLTEERILIMTLSRLAQY